MIQIKYKIKVYLMHALASNLNYINFQSEILVVDDDVFNHEAIEIILE